MPATRYAYAYVSRETKHNRPEEPLDVKKRVLQVGGLNCEGGGWRRAGRSVEESRDDVRGSSDGVGSCDRGPSAEPSRQERRADAGGAGPSPTLSMTMARTHRTKQSYSIPHNRTRLTISNLQVNVSTSNLPLSRFLTISFCTSSLSSDFRPTFSISSSYRFEGAVSWCWFWKEVIVVRVLGWFGRGSRGRKWGQRKREKRDAIHWGRGDVTVRFRVRVV